MYQNKVVLSTADAHKSHCKKQTIKASDQTSTTDKVNLQSPANKILAQKFPKAYKVKLVQPLQHGQTHSKTRNWNKLFSSENPESIEDKYTCKKNQSSLKGQSPPTISMSALADSIISRCSTPQFQIQKSMEDRSYKKKIGNGVISKKSEIVSPSSVKRDNTGRFSLKNQKMSALYSQKRQNYLKLLTQATLITKVNDFMIKRDFYEQRAILEILFDQKKHQVALFKEYLIYDDISNFTAHFYQKDQARIALAQTAFVHKELQNPQNHISQQFLQEHKLYVNGLKPSYISIQDDHISKNLLRNIEQKLSSTLNKVNQSREIQSKTPAQKAFDKLIQTTFVKEYSSMGITTVEKKYTNQGSRFSFDQKEYSDAGIASKIILNGASKKETCNPQEVNVKPRPQKRETMDLDGPSILEEINREHITDQSLFQSFIDVELDRNHNQLQIKSKPRKQQGVSAALQLVKFLGFEQSKQTFKPTILSNLQPQYKKVAQVSSIENMNENQLPNPPNSSAVLATPSPKITSKAPICNNFNNGITKYPNLENDMDLPKQEIPVNDNFDLSAIKQYKQFKEDQILGIPQSQVVSTEKSIKSKTPDQLTNETNKKIKLHKAFFGKNLTGNPQLVKIS